jgi:hypothetical protein
LHLSWFPVALLDAMVLHLWDQKWSTFVNIERFVFASEVCPDVLGTRFIRMRIRLPLNHVRPIRCKCNNNRNHRFAIIRCSQCGYYVHRRCAGLLYGPLPRGYFICGHCGRSKFKYPKVPLPATITFDMHDVLFTQDIADALSTQTLDGPFSDFLTNDIVDHDLSARDFCECF